MKKQSVQFAILALIFSTPLYAGTTAAEMGKKVYANACASCHGLKGDGNGPVGANLNPKPRNLVNDKFKNGDKPQQVLASITKGIPGTLMTGYAYLSEKERKAVTQYVLSFRKK